MNNVMNDFERMICDEAHEHAVLDAIIEAIAKSSLISEPPVLCFRTGEIAVALTSALVLTLAMSTSTARSPVAIRKRTDDLRRRLIKGVANAVRDPVVSAEGEHEHEPT
jgi:hypothetical protein